MIKHKENWTHGSVVEKHEMPRSYVVETSNGKKYRRNRRYLKPTKSVTDDVNSEEDRYDPKPYHSECVVQPGNTDEGNRTLASKPGSPHVKKTQDEDVQPRKSTTKPADSEARSEVVSSPLKTKSGREVKKPLRFRES